MPDSIREIHEQIREIHEHWMQYFHRVDEDGTIYLTERPVPLPKSLSPEARAWHLAKFRQVADPRHLTDHQPITALEMGALSDRIADVVDQRWLRAYPVDIRRRSVIGNVATDVVTPIGDEPIAKNRALINLYPASGVFGQNQCYEGIVIANMMRAKVYIPRFRREPQHSLLDGLEDVCGVYKQLLDEYPAANIGVFGSSSGGNMAAQVTSRLLQERLPTPGAIALLATALDFEGDSHNLNQGLYPNFLMLSWQRDIHKEWASKARDAKRIQPNGFAVQPIRAAFNRFPPTLLVAGGRDLGCSGTTLAHREMRKAGVDADLFVFDGMPHVFYRELDFPESKELFENVSKFFDKKLGGAIGA
jgi:epsilon-lactone hydrolase